MYSTAYMPNCRNAFLTRPGVSRRINWQNEESGQEPTYRPWTDIAEDEGHVYLQVELPGVEKSDIKVTVNKDNVLTIEAEKKQAENAGSALRRERHFGKFQRSFQLDSSIDAEKIDAFFEAGILTLTLDKKQPRELVISD